MAEDDGLEPGDAIYAMFIPPEWAEHYIRAMDTPSQRLAQEVQKAEESQPPENMVPAQYHDFRDIFSKEAFDELPPQKVWDHTIDLSPGTELPHSLSGHIQDWEHMRCLGACGALTYLQGVTQGEWVPAECLCRSVIMYKSKYIHGGTLPE